ncbi:hypothetical protein SDC9_104414 [bioreactor metagenome]|uniref:Uncharacterized protein n=1 Tax=bioreactor metagenome TaxID=1076179 RepID=A0A645AWG6_9ZZZZ
MPGIFASLIFVALSSSIHLSILTKAMFFLLTSLKTSSYSLPKIVDTFLAASFLSLTSTGLHHTVYLVTLTANSFIFLSYIVPLLGSIGISLVCWSVAFVLNHSPFINCRYPVLIVKPKNRAHANIRTSTNLFLLTLFIFLLKCFPPYFLTSMYLI